MDADIYHFHDPELIPIGLLLKCRGKKVIYDVHEDVPAQILDKYYLSVTIRKLFYWIACTFEFFANKMLNAIITATEKIAERFSTKKTIVIHNYPIVKELMHNSSVPYNKRNSTFVYPGDISKSRGIIEVLKALEILNSQSIRFELAGEFSPLNFKEKAMSLSGWRFVNYYGFLSREQISYLINNARCGLVLHHPIPNEIYAQPIKLFEFMAAGIPVIASDFPIIRDIIDHENCGIVVNPLKSNEIAKAMIWILEHPIEAEQMGQNGRKAVLEKYNWERESKKLLRLYEDLLH